MRTILSPVLPYLISSFSALASPSSGAASAAEEKEKANKHDIKMQTINFFTK